MNISKKEDLTMDTVLSKVSEYQIYRWFIGKDFKLGQPINSPFRKDNNPSFSIMATRYGKLYHTDFANTKYRGTVIDFIQQLFSLNYGEALQKIDNDMGLGISGTKNAALKHTLALYQEPKIEKADTFIQVTSKPFDSQDLAYWNQYHIDLADLKKNNVYSVKKLYVNRSASPLSRTELCFGYLMEDVWKIYRPYALKKDKWRSNIPIDRMWGMNSISKSKKGVVTKALKDKMVLEKFLPWVGAVQNESTVSINNTNILLLQENFEEVYINMDNDEAGITNCKYYNQYGFGWINSPAEVLPIKDFADMAKVHGMEPVINHFKLKGII